MACGGCQQTRRDLAAALRRGQVVKAAETAAQGMRHIVRTVKAPPLLRHIVRRVR